MNVDLEDVIALIKYRKDFLEKTMLRELQLFNESEKKEINELMSIKGLQESIKQLDIVISEIQRNVNTSFMDYIKIKGE